MGACTISAMRSHTGARESTQRMASARRAHAWAHRLTTMVFSPTAVGDASPPAAASRGGVAWRGVPRRGEVGGLAAGRGEAGGLAAVRARRRAGAAGVGGSCPAAAAGSAPSGGASATRLPRRRPCIAEHDWRARADADGCAASQGSHRCSREKTELDSPPRPLSYRTRRRQHGARLLVLGEAREHAPRAAARGRVPRPDVPGHGRRRHRRPRAHRPHPARGRHRHRGACVSRARRRGAPTRLSVLLRTQRHAHASDAAALPPPRSPCARSARWTSCGTCWSASPRTG